MGPVGCPDQWVVPKRRKLYYQSKKKVNRSRYMPSVAQREGRGIAPIFHDRGTGRGLMVSSTPPPHFSPGKTRYLFYRRLGGPQGRSGRAENLVPTGIRSRIIQPLLPVYVAWYPRRAKISFAPRRKPKFTQIVTSQEGPFLRTWVKLQPFVVIAICPKY